MATWYYASVGYDSGINTEKDILDGFNLYDVALEILDAHKYELKNFLSVEYSIDSDDVDAYFDSCWTIRPDKDDVLAFYMITSGGGKGRSTKEIIAYQFLLFLASKLFRTTRLVLNIRVS